MSLEVVVITVIRKGASIMSHSSNYIQSPNDNNHLVCKQKTHNQNPNNLPRT